MVADLTREWDADRNRSESVFTDEFNRLNNLRDPYRDGKGLLKLRGCAYGSEES